MSLFKVAPIVHPNLFPVDPAAPWGQPQHRFVLSNLVWQVLSPGPWNAVEGQKKPLKQQRVGCTNGASTGKDMPQSDTVPQLLADRSEQGSAWPHPHVNR